MPCDLVNYLSTFVKPSDVKNETTLPQGTKRRSIIRPHIGKRVAPISNPTFKCFSWGQIGHKQTACPTNHKPTSSNNAKINDVKHNPKITCAYCKK